MMDSQTLMFFHMNVIITLKCVKLFNRKTKQTSLNYCIKCYCFCSPYEEMYEVVVGL